MGLISVNKEDGQNFLFKMQQIWGLVYYSYNYICSLKAQKKKHQILVVLPQIERYFFWWRLNLDIVWAFNFPLYHDLLLWKINVDDISAVGEFDFCN